MNYDRTHIFENSVYSDANKMHRWVRPNIFDQYFATIVYYIDQNKINNILDIGCGTGQFAVNLALRCPAANVTALDSSESQLKKMQTVITDEAITNITIKCSRFENFESKQLFDVIICSEAIHLFDDLALFAQNVSEILAPGGVVCIRTPSPKQYAERSIYNFFPRCRYINLEKCKGPELLDAAFSLYGLGIKESLEIDESRRIYTPDLLGMFKSKAFSTLHLLPDDEYENGIRMVEDFANEHDYYDYDFKMTEYIVMYR